MKALQWGVPKPQSADLGGFQHFGRLSLSLSLCPCACACVCVRACVCAKACACGCEWKANVMQHSNRILTAVTFCNHTLKTANGKTSHPCQYSHCPQHHTLPTFRRMFLQAIAVTCQEYHSTINTSNKTILY